MWRVDGMVIEITSLFTLFNRSKVVIKQYKSIKLVRRTWEYSSSV
jgi:hypothetical protein